MNTYRLAVFAPHPVQYHVGIYRELAKLPDVDAIVFYEDRIGLDPVYVKEFGTTIQWDVDLLSGYEHRFLRNLSRKPQSGFLARINPSVVSAIFKGQYDAVLFAGYNRLTDWLVFAAARLTQTPIIFRGEATPRLEDARVPQRRRLKNRFLAMWLRRCAAVLYSCDGNREYFRGYGVPDTKMRCIPCAVDNAFFQKERERYMAQRDEVREELGFKADDLVLVLAAQLTPRKRPADLIDAVALSERQDVAILYIGNGPLRTELEERAAARGVRAVFTGFVNQGEISRYYVAGDCFAMLSSYDASPKALNEALNFGMPAICTRTTGTAYDLVVHGKNGFHVDAGDIAAIARRVVMWAEDRSLVALMGKRSEEIVSAWSFSADAEAIRATLVEITCDR